MHRVIVIEDIQVVTVSWVSFEGIQRVIINYPLPEEGIAEDEVAETVEEDWDHMSELLDLRFEVVVVDIDLDEVGCKYHAYDDASYNFAPILCLDGLEEESFPLLNLIIRHVARICIFYVFILFLLLFFLLLLTLPLPSFFCFLLPITTGCIRFVFFPIFMMILVRIFVRRMLLMMKIILILFGAPLLCPSPLLLLRWLRDLADASTPIVLFLQLGLLEATHALVLVLLLLGHRIFVILIKDFVNVKQTTRFHPFQPSFCAFMLFRSCHSNLGHITHHRQSPLNHLSVDILSGEVVR